MLEWMWIGIVTVLVFGVTFGVAYGLALRRARYAARLTGSNPDIDSAPDIFLGPAGPVIAQQLPMSGEKASEVREELIQAGFYSPQAVTSYAAVRNILILVPLFLAGFLALLVDRSAVATVLLGGLIGAGLGYSLPRIYLVLLGRRRRREIEKGLPVAVDMMALGLLGGQTVPNALHRVTREVRTSFPVLATELEIVRDQAQLNTLPHALAQFADRVRLAEIRNLVVLLTQAERQGTDVASALMEFASTFRTGLRQRADKQANQASFWMLFPSIIFLWLPAFVLLMAPLWFEFQSKRRASRELQERARQVPNLANPPAESEADSPNQ